MSARFDVAALGNAIVDVIAPSEDAFLQAEGLDKGSMRLIDDDRADELYGRMAPGVEASGGSAGNTIAGVASFGGRAAYVGKVADDQLGGVFAHDIRALGVHFEVAPLTDGPATGRCLINVTPDGQRTMCTYLGAANQLTPADVDPNLIRDAAVTFLEGYLFDPEEARRAFEVAAQAARSADRMISLTLSDAFVVERHRDALIQFLPNVDVLFANAAEIASLFQTDDFESAVGRIRQRVKIAAVTHGEQGSVIVSGEQTHRIAAEPVDKVVDTTGAGDQYAAGVLFGVARGLPLDQAGRLGSIAAAEVIGHYGPRPLVSLKALASAAGIEAPSA